jgi:phosphate transport system permease protein
LNTQSTTVKLQEQSARTILAAFTVVSVATTIGIIAILSFETFAFFSEISLREFFLDSNWAPLLEPRHFGIWPLINGTFLITAGAAFVGLPTGVLIAIYLNEFAPKGLARIVKPILEVLAGVPTIVYGYFAITVITPFLRSWFESVEVFNALSGAVVVGIMIIPLVASISDDAIKAVPKSIKDGGYALGATKFEVIRHITLPAASSGITAAFILALSRAVGETMAVTLAAGSTPKLTANFFESIQTMTAYIVQVCMGDVPHTSIEYKSIFAVGAVLFIITFSFNIAANLIIRRWRKMWSGAAH